MSVLAFHSQSLSPLRLCIPTCAVLLLMNLV